MSQITTSTSPRFGIFVLPVVDTDSPDEAHRELRLAVEDVKFAEDLGFDAAWVAEHHGTKYGGICPSATTMLAYCAAATSSIRLGTAVSVIPLNDPIRLAEEALLLDHLSDGRFQMGLGSGFLGVDFTTLNVPIESKQERFARGLPVIVRTLRSGRPSYDDGSAFPSLYPPRFSANGIALWGAAAMSADNIAAFARAGLGLMLNPYTRSPDEVRNAIAAYREQFAASGYDVSDARVMIHEHLFAASTEVDARERPREYLMRYLSALREASALAADGTRTTHGTGPEDYNSLYPKHVAFGTPTQLRHRIVEWSNAGVTDFAFSIRFGGMPREIARRSMELLCREVLPQIRDGIR